MPRVSRLDLLRPQPRKPGAWRRLGRRVLVYGGMVALALLYVTQPLLCVRRVAPTSAVYVERLRAHVAVLAGEMTPRTAAHPQNLDRAADYIRDQLEAAGLPAEFQPFDATGGRFRNVLAHAGPEDGPRIVVGAHYDAADAGIGADDNASGVAGLLELACHLAATKPRTRVDLVAYSLEEPPYFRTHGMGSFVHAESLKRAGVDVQAVIVLEMIGCFRDADGSQEYPVPGLGWFYPSRGNFIVVVGCVGQASLTRRVKRAMAEASDLDVRSMNAPRTIAGIDFSDHLNYWDQGYDAVMVSDTAFYRNPHYHERSDRPATLDYPRMAQVVTGLARAIDDLAGN